MYDEAKMMETVSRTDSEAGPLSAALLRLDKAAAESEELIARLDSRLHPVLRPEQECAETDQLNAVSPPTAPNTAHVYAIASRLDRLNGRITGITDRVEV